MTISGGVQFGGGYYSRITNSQYILYNENNVKIYDFTSPAEHSNGNQKAIYRVRYWCNPTSNYWKLILLRL